MTYKKEEQAFSLVEILVALIAVSCISAALAPVITKKLKSNGVSIGGGGVGGGLGGSSNYDPNLTMNCEANFGSNCQLCYTNACIDCTLVCPEGDYKNVSSCECITCSSIYGEFCTDCDTNVCKRCSSGHGLTSGGGCTDSTCPEGQYTEGGETLCKTCEAGYRCTGGIKYVCALDEYSNPGSATCIKCSTAITNCDRCTSANNCTSCEPGFSLENGACTLSMDSVEYTKAGEYALAVPDKVKKIIVTLVSGGAGGGAGNIVAMTETFVTSGTGNSPNNATNLVHVSSNGLYTWNIPASVRGTNVLVSACGGGGGGSNSAGGRGGIFKNRSIPMPDKATIGIITGGGGGAGNSQSSGCAYGGGGGVLWTSHVETRVAACGATGVWGSGGVWHSAGGYGGYDPIFNDHGAGGGWGSAWGSRVGGGGGASKDSWNGSGGGGGATLFKDNSLALVANYVAPGGGGGCDHKGYAGGGGGGIGGGAGASPPGTSTKAPPAGGNGSGSDSNVFGSTYCNGGGSYTRGKNGAMRIAYIDKPNGGSGGGAGHMVVNQEISVIPNDILTIIVGRGGKGGTAGIGDTSTMTLNSNSTNGESASDEMVSKILNGAGATLITSAPNISIMGTSGGNIDGTTIGERGFISNGVAVMDMGAKDGFANNSGAAANGMIGGAGGQTYLGDDSVLHCVAKSGGAFNVAAQNAGPNEYGGCGGAGGGAGADGGDGAQGYVKITIVKEESSE